MSTYIAEKYAGLLTEEDVSVLFSRLSKEFRDNRSEAARQCGLTGKATYDWENAAYVKLGTKRKVLDASLKKNFLNTMEYLLSKSNDRNLDLLQIILSTLYANALEAPSSENFKEAFARFETIRMNNLGKIRDGIQIQVTDMTEILKDKAVELGIPVAPKAIDEFSAEEILNTIKLVGHVYSENPIQAETLALRDIGLPSNAVKPIVETFHNLCLTRKIQTSTTEGEEKMRHHIIGMQTIALTRTHWIDSHRPYLASDDVGSIPPIEIYTQGGLCHEVTTNA